MPLARIGAVCDITPAEAGSHPQRSLLLRAIDGNGPAEPALSLHHAQAGDRYLLCTDGLTAVVPAPAIRDTLTAPGDPERAVARLIGPPDAPGPGQHRVRGSRPDQPGAAAGARGLRVTRDQAGTDGPAPSSLCLAPAGWVAGRAWLTSGPRRNTSAATIEPAARMPAVQAKPLS